MKTTSNQQSGFSLVEVMISVGIFSALTVTTAYVAVQSKATQARADIQSQIDQLHQYSLNYVQQIKTYSPTSGLENINILQQNIFSKANARGCLEQTTPNTECNSLDGVSLISNLGLQGLAQDLDSNCSGAKCRLASAVKMTFNCKEKVCQSITIDITTPSINVGQGAKGGYQFLYRKRKSSVGIPASVFSQKSEAVLSLDMSCVTAGQLLTNLNYDSNRVECNNVAPRACSSTAAVIRGIASSFNLSCISGESASCSGSRGAMQNIGLLQTDAKCVSAVGLSAVGTAPTTIPPTTTVPPVTTTTTTVPPPTTMPPLASCWKNSSTPSATICTQEGTCSSPGATAVSTCYVLTAGAWTYVSQALSCATGTFGSDSSCTKKVRCAPTGWRGPRLQFKNNILGVSTQGGSAAQKPYNCAKYCEDMGATYCQQHRKTGECVAFGPGAMGPANYADCDHCYVLSCG